MLAPDGWALGWTNHPKSKVHLRGRSWTNGLAACGARLVRFDIVKVDEEGEPQDLGKICYRCMKEAT